MLTVLAFLAASQPAMAADASMPSRPTIYPVDDLLSNGSVENFREVYVDPKAVVTSLSPVKAPSIPGANVAPAVGPSVPPTGVLPVINEMSSWAEIAVNDTKIGVIGPLTNGAIHGLRSGVYNVSFTIMNGYTETLEVQTVLATGVILPGGESGRERADAGDYPSWHTNHGMGHVTPVAPTAPASAVDELLNDDDAGE
jgi:hypothetical protein